MSSVGDNGQVVESGVGGAPTAGPKSKLNPVLMKGLGGRRSLVSIVRVEVGAGLGWLGSRRQLGCRSWGVLVREGGELREL